VHCIGDLANKLILDAYEENKVKFGVNLSATRSRIEHAQILQVQDIPRLGSLGIIPSVQPTHIISDMSYVRSRIGQGRELGAYVWRGFLEAEYATLHIANAMLTFAELQVCL
jgi:predicted amidohydrolase YtcJ